MRLTKNRGRDEHAASAQIRRPTTTNRGLSNTPSLDCWSRQARSVASAFRSVSALLGVKLTPKVTLGRIGSRAPFIQCPTKLELLPIIVKISHPTGEETATMTGTRCHC